MFFRAFITSGLISSLFIALIFSLGELPLGNSLMYQVLATFWSIGFLSIIGFIYGRKIKRNFRGETGTIKWFDPSKGYGFLIRDKGGDLFVHLRSVQTQDIQDNVGLEEHNFFFLRISHVHEFIANI